MTYLCGSRNGIRDWVTTLITFENATFWHLSRFMMLRRFFGVFWILRRGTSLRTRLRIVIRMSAFGMMIYTPPLRCTGSWRKIFQNICWRFKVLVGIESCSVHHIAYGSQLGISFPSTKDLTIEVCRAQESTWRSVIDPVDSFPDRI
jgi:hypothetical protein